MQFAAVLHSQAQGRRGQRGGAGHFGLKLMDVVDGTTVLGLVEVLKQRSSSRFFTSKPGDRGGDATAPATAESPKQDSSSQIFTPRLRDGVGGATVLALVEALKQDCSRQAFTLELGHSTASDVLGLALVEALQQGGSWLSLTLPLAHSSKGEATVLAFAEALLQRGSLQSFILKLWDRVDARRCWPSRRLSSSAARRGSSLSSPGAALTTRRDWPSRRLSSSAARRSSSPWSFASSGEGGSSNSFGSNTLPPSVWIPGPARPAPATASGAPRTRRGRLQQQLREQHPSAFRLDPGASEASSSNGFGSSSNKARAAPATASGATPFRLPSGSRGQRGQLQQRLRELLAFLSSALLACDRCKPTK